MTLDVVVLVVSVAPGIPRRPTRRVQQQQQCTIPTYIRTRYRMYVLYQISYIYTWYAYDTWNVYVDFVRSQEPFLAFLG